MCEVIEDYRRNVETLRSVAEGSRVAHVWRSPSYPGADMIIRTAWPDFEIDPNDHGQPLEFAESVQLEYAGTLTRDEAAQKLAKLQAAAHSHLDIY